MMKRKLALASWVVAVILSVAALLLPPTGYIDHSVLLLIAQFLLLCATFLGVKPPTLEDVKGEGLNSNRLRLKE